MEAKVTISNKVLVVGKFRTLSLELELPVTEYRIELALRELRVGSAVDRGIIKVEWLNDNGDLFGQLGNSFPVNHIYELNHLTERVAALDKLGRDKLNAMCAQYLDEASFTETGLPEYEPTIAHAINLTHNLEGLQGAEGARDGYVYSLPPHDIIQHPYDGKSMLLRPSPEQKPEPEQNGGISMDGM